MVLIENRRTYKIVTLKASGNMDTEKLKRKLGKKKSARGQTIRRLTISRGEKNQGNSDMSGCFSPAPRIST